MSFRLVPNSVILDDLERRNSPNCGVISPDLIDIWADYVKVVKVHQNFPWISLDGQGTKWRRKIEKNFNRLSRAHKRYRRQTDGRVMT